MRGLFDGASAGVGGRGNRRVRPSDDRGTVQDDSAADFHAAAGAEVLKLLQSSRDGLSNEEALVRLRRFGPNRLPAAMRRSGLQRFASQFHNVLIYVLLLAAAVTAALGQFVDAGVILGVVVINAAIGFIQEGRAEQSLDAIRRLMPEFAFVIRGGARMCVPGEDLVKGDIVALQPGDKVPADLRLLKCRGLQIQEAALTGESVPSEKTSEPVARETALGDRLCMAFSGTIVARGQAIGVAVATGEGTEIGRVKTLLQRVQTLETPLTRQLSRFARVLTFFILLFAAAAMAFGILVHGLPVADGFMAAVAIAVAAIPEGLPAVVTITLAIGVERMAKRHAIIRRLPAVETLGAVSVICSDKTGTFTRNEMMVQSIATSRHLFAVTGSGYAPEGEVLLDGVAAGTLHRPLLGRMSVAAVLCNDARLVHDDGGWSVDGDPMEGAMLVAAVKAGLDVEETRAATRRVDEIPFDAEHRFMATLSHESQGQATVFVKGAPERLLQMCGRQIAYGGEQPLDSVYWEERMAAMTARGERVLALAVKVMPEATDSLSFADVETDLSLLGFVGLIDAPSEEAIAAVKQCRRAGIDVKMITGDHIGTARAVGEQLHLAKPHAAIEGTQIDHLSDAGLQDIVDDIDVFARVNPEGKLRIVEALQAKNRVVAMTGDGVNDAPALRRADIGVAMGRRGTEAAKEASEMVLADDNFASIAAAVEEGRVVYDNLTKAIQFMLPTNVGEALTLLAAVLFGLTLPITPVQILWVNMVTAVTLALALAFEAPEGDVMARLPRRPDAPILSGHLIWRVVFVSLVIVGGVFAVFVWKTAGGEALAVARTAAVNTLVLFEVFYLFNTRRRGVGHYRQHFAGGARPAWIAVGIVLMLQVFFTHLPSMNLLFHSAPISAVDWLICVSVAASVFVLVELEKSLTLVATRARQSVP